MQNKELIITLTKSNFQKEVLEETRPVIVEVAADWCGTCYIIEPILEKLATTYLSKIKFGILDFDLNSQITNKYCIANIPNLLFFINGNLVDHVIGAISFNDLQNKIETLLNINGLINRKQ
jgi:thioredoxin 1